MITTKKDILDLIYQDQKMMEVLQTAEQLKLPDWLIGAGFIRNKVWDYLHGNSQTAFTDIDLVYFDPNGNDQQSDKLLSNKLAKVTSLTWEVVNEAYAHRWNNELPYLSATDAIAHWPETATSIGLKLDEGKLTLVSPYGINDLINLIVKPSPKFKDGFQCVKERAERKHWLKKWPKLQLVDR